MTDDVDSIVRSAYMNEANGQKLITVPSKWSASLDDGEPLDDYYIARIDDVEDDGGVFGRSQSILSVAKDALRESEFEEIYEEMEDEDAYELAEKVNKVARSIEELKEHIDEYQ